MFHNYSGKTYIYMNIVPKKTTFYSKLRMSQNAPPRPGPSRILIGEEEVY